METVCYVCQEYENEIGHITRLCPKKECKKCGQIGHFGYECESLVNISIKKENCNSNIVEDNNDEIKTENHVNDEFSESVKESSSMFNLESISPEKAKVFFEMTEELTKTKQEFQEVKSMNKNLSEQLNLANRSIIEIKNNDVYEKNDKLIAQVQKLKDETIILSFKHEGMKNFKRQSRHLKIIWKKSLMS